MNLARQHALVSGGCGFVGRHFVKRLLDRGYLVTIVDDLSTGLDLEQWPEHLKLDEAERRCITYEPVDFRDYMKTRPPDFDLILHLAAVVGGRIKIDGDPLSVATDLAIDATFFNWLAKNQPSRATVLYFSSSAAYPTKYQTRSLHFPLAEDLIDFGRGIELPDMTYGWSKLSGEYLAQFAAKNYGIHVLIYRPFSGYGEDQDLSYPFPSIIRRVFDRESPIIIWGSGDQVRDFIHIDDVTNAVLASFPKMKPGEVLNLGSGVGTTFRDLAESACRIAGHRAQVTNDSAKPEGVFARVGDCRRMFDFYRPQITLEQGIKRALSSLMRKGV